MSLASLRKRVLKAPTAPGVYRWLDEAGVVIYVGKAKNLKNRLKSYVAATAEKGQGPWKQSMLRQLADFDVTITRTEVEALILETNLIKEMRPKYNVLMKDDKNYVYVRISVADAYPKIEITRQLEHNSAKYFGPYLSNFETKRILDMLHEFFGWRACRQSIDALNKAFDGESGEPRESIFNTGKLKPCLDSQIGQCNGLCCGTMTQEEYRSRVDQVMKFLRGDYKPVLTQGRELMAKYAAERKFEKASRIRDALKFIEDMEKKQIVSDTSGDNTDAVGIALLSGKAHVEVLLKRGGKLIGEHHLPLMGKAESIADVLEQFLPQYYEGVVELPDTILVQEDFQSHDALAELLSERHVRKVSIAIPERGNKSQLLDLAQKNAEEKAKQAEASWEAEERNVKNALDELMAALKLPAIPKRIECYDISHTGGTETVGSMVVCVNGRPKNDDYRSFTMRTIKDGEVNDYKSLREVLVRRLRYLKSHEELWNDSGVVFEKAKKADKNFIEDTLRSNEQTFAGELSYQEFVVARKGEDILGFGRLAKRSGNIHLIQSVWVSEHVRGNKLGHAIIRKLLAKAKKGKVYITIHPQLEEYYAQLGFRYTKIPPAILQKEIENAKANDPYFPEGGRIVMMYNILQNKIDSSLTAFPNLLVIDGGKGQLSTVVAVLKEFQLQIPVIGLAKREEEVFLPEQKVSIVLPKDSPAKFLLMRIRDEAHRFANRHREKRALKHAVESQLDRIPGLGTETKQKLLKEFGSVDVIRTKSDEVLLKIVSEEQLRMMREIL